MIRTVWLAVACLAVLVALGIGKALTTPVAAPAERRVEETTIGADFGQETLTKADRLEIAYVPPKSPALAVLQPVEPLGSAISSTVQQAETKIVSRHWHDPNAPASSAAGTKRTRLEPGACLCLLIFLAVVSPGDASAFGRVIFGNRML